MNRQKFSLPYQDRLHGNTKVSADISPLVDNGHLMDQWYRVEQVAQVDESTAHHTEPREAVVEGIATG